MGTRRIATRDAAAPAPLTLVLLSLKVDALPRLTALGRENELHTPILFAPRGCRAEKHGKGLDPSHGNWFEVALGQGQRVERGEDTQRNEHGKTTQAGHSVLQATLSRRHE